MSKDFNSLSLAEKVPKLKPKKRKLKQVFKFHNSIRDIQDRLESLNLENTKIKILPKIVE